MPWTIKTNDVGPLVDVDPTGAGFYDDVAMGLYQQLVEGDFIVLHDGRILAFVKTIQVDDLSVYSAKHALKFEVRTVDENGWNHMLLDVMDIADIIPSPDAGPAKKYSDHNFALPAA